MLLTITTTYRPATDLGYLLHKHFKPTEVLSSDFCRGLVSDDENDRGASTNAFAVLHFIAAKRLCEVIYYESIHTAS